jgi:hypothetical protein
MKDMVGTGKITAPGDAMLHLILKYADRTGENDKIIRKATNYLLRRANCAQRKAGGIFNGTQCNVTEKWRSCDTIKCKGKVHPRTGHEGPEGEQRYSPTLSLTSALDGGWVVKATARPLCPRERHGTHYTGGWVGPRAGLDGCGKSRPHRDSIPRQSSP